jgi:hypothetical protein
MGHKYNKQVFPVHTPSFLHGAMVVGAQSHYGHKEYMNFLRISPTYPPSSAFAFISFPVFFRIFYQILYFPLKQFRIVFFGKFQHF